jgi:exodeoxyribonuclease VII large subunit
MLRLSERRKSELRGLMRALPTGESLLTAPRQRLDLALARLAPGLMRNARVHETRLVELRRRLQRQAPEARLREARLRLAALTQRLPGALDRNAERRRERLTAQAGRLRVALSGVTRAETQRIARDGTRLRDLDARRRAAARRLVARARERLQNIAQFAASLDYRRVLQRGYAVVRGAGGVIDHASAVTPGLRLEIEFRDGRVAAIAGEAGREPAATEPAEPARAAPRPAPRKPPGADQGSLF